MSSNRWLCPGRTVRTRLTLLFAGLFALLAVLVLVAVDVALRHALQTRMDDDLRGAVGEFDTLYRQYGLEALRDEFRREAEARGSENVVLLLRSPGHAVLASSDLIPWRGFDLEPDAAPGPAPIEAQFRTIRLTGFADGLRLLTARLRDGNVLQIGRSLGPDRLLVARTRRVFGTGILGMLGIGVMLGWFIARRAMMGVERVAQTAASIGVRDLSLRVPVSGQGAEIDGLAMAFNAMLDRIDRLLTELRDVTDNVAHDLRSPITRIRGLAETTLTGSADLQEFREMAGMVVQECDDLINLVATMLEIAEAHAGVAELEVTAVDLSRLLREAHDLFAPAAEDCGLTLGLSLAPESIMVRADRRRLQRVVANLLDNAVKYTPAGGRVTLAAVAADGFCRVTVTDTGPGIAPREAPRIFERFYRGDRSRSTSGNGLGLSLALALANLHGGTISVAANRPQGAVFTVTLPHNPPHDQKVI